MESTNVRRATSSDIPLLASLDHHYSTDHVWQMGYNAGSGDIAISFREVRLPRAMRVEYPRDPGRLADEWNAKLSIQVAEADEEKLGYVTLVEGPAAGSVWITDLVVDLPHRRQGVATRLVAAAREWARQARHGRMFLEMQSKNYPAICLARKLGFAFTGYSDRYYPDQDIALFFALDLA
jgi:GNAT superfamily N-acetyltransferase